MEAPRHDHTTAAGAGQIDAAGIYINGVLVGDHQGTTGTSWSATSRCGSAAASVDLGRVPGMIDEVRIYNRALSVAEIGRDMVTPIVP